MLTDEHPGRHLASFVSLGLASWSAGDTAAAASLFRRVERADVFEERTEAAALCRLALQDPLNRAKLLDYFVSGAGDSARLALLEAMTLDPERTPVPLYLKAKLLVRGDRPAEALSVLGLIDLSRHEPRLEALRRRTMGICLYTMGNYQTARAAFWTSLNHRSDEVWQLRITEWIDRCEWESERNGQGMLRQSPGGVGEPGVPGTNGLREHDATVVAVEADRPGGFPAPERSR